MSNTNKNRSNNVQHTSSENNKTYSETIQTMFKQCSNKVQKNVPKQVQTQLINNPEKTLKQIQAMFRNSSENKTHNTSTHDEHTS
jgi:hypothetical protein